MGDSLLFGFGVFVMLLFTAGILFTVKEFKDMDQEAQKKYREKPKNMRINTDD